MQHVQYNTIYPRGAFIYDPKNQINIFGDRLDKPISINSSIQMSRDDLLIELIVMDVWMEQKKITNTKNDQIAHIKKLLDGDKKYDFYISDQKMKMIDGPYNINFHSIVNRLISPDKLQFTKFDRTIDWMVIPLFGNIECYFPRNYSIPKNNLNSYNDCIKGNKTQMSMQLTEQRAKKNNQNHRSHIIKNLKYVRNKNRNNLENANDCFEQSIWIRDINGIEQFGPETTGKVMLNGLFNILYFISLVRMIGHDTISITLHRINPIKYETF